MWWRHSQTSRMALKSCRWVPWTFRMGHCVIFGNLQRLISIAIGVLFISISTVEGVLICSSERWTFTHQFSVYLCKISIKHRWILQNCTCLETFHVNVLKGIETRHYLILVFHIYIKIKYICNMNKNTYILTSGGPFLRIQRMFTRITVMVIETIAHWQCTQTFRRGSTECCVRCRLLLVFWIK